MQQSSSSYSSSAEKKVFCNVELNCQNLEAVGFDMDFTLAQYNEDFDLLAYEGAKQRLFNMLNYPKQVLDFKYSPDSFRRGLVIDKKRGNILKIDRHKYVRQAKHGSRELSRAERKVCYQSQVATFTESNYVNIDTLFQVIDAILFAQLVDFKDDNLLLSDKSYEQIYRDVRKAVDLCHRDGVIKDTVAKNPAKYIIYDPMLVPMIAQLRDAGKKVFLLTNSMWEYTNVVMNYLVHGRGENSEMRWEDLFDIIIVGACKPGFLTDEYLSMFKVDSSTGVLKNIEDKDSLTIGLRDGQHKVFQGGYWQDLHKMMNITLGEKILYVGDHMYSDILRSKRTLGWRTCLIIPELENEVQTAQRETALSSQVTKTQQLQYDLDEYLDLLRQKQRLGVDVSSNFEEADQKSSELKSDLRTLSDSYNRKFNRYWGQLLKAGFQDSRFAKQVMDYACLYTSRASNIGYFSPSRTFRPVQDFMPHDQVMLDAEYLKTPSQYTLRIESSNHN
eukprot:gene4190-5961_t